MDMYNSPYSLDQHLSSIRHSFSTPILTRDFAYAHHSPVILQEHTGMARGHITEFSADIYAELLSGPTVDIYVGKQRKHWALHQNLLCHYSSYFQTELHGYEVPKDRNAATLELPDDDPRGFSLLVKWLYQGRLDDVSDLSDEEHYEYAVACYKLYQLCDRFSMFALKTLAMDSYRASLHAAQLVPDAEEINEIYRASPPESPFRKLMVSIAARQIMDPEVEKDAGSYRCCFEGNADFAVEVVNAIRRASGGMLFDDPTESDECAWHDHRDGSTCLEKPMGRSQLNGEGRAVSKIKSPDLRKDQTPSTPMNTSNARSTPRRPNNHSNQSLPDLARPPPVKVVRLDTASLQDQPNKVHSPTTSSSQLSTAKSKPRKLERTPAKPSPVSVTAVANESRKLTPNPRTRVTIHVGDSQAKSSPAAIRLAQTAAAAVGQGPIAIQGAHSANHVDGIVRRFNSLNGTASEASMNGNAVKRRPPKLKYKIGA